MAKLSQELHHYFFEEERGETVSLGQIFALAKERAFGFLFVILALPSALPIPAPGYSIPFGVLLFILALQLIAGREKPWLPGAMVKKSLPTPKAQKVVQAALPWLRKLEALTKPRLLWLCHPLGGRMAMGGLVALMALSMMIPIPGTNTLPAMGIFLIGFGLQEDDGVISLGGMVFAALVAIAMGSVFYVALYGGTSAIDSLKLWLQGLGNG